MRKIRHWGVDALHRFPATHIDTVENVADRAYFELEGLLDRWRRRGMPEGVVRTVLDRARRASSAMEDLGKRLSRP
jgi:hypothetical protein